MLGLRFGLTSQIPNPPAAVHIRHKASRLRRLSLYISHRKRSLRLILALDDLI